MLDLLIGDTLLKAVEANTVNILTLFLLLVDKGLITDEEYMAAHARASAMVKEELTKGANDDAKTVEQTS